MGLQEDSLLSSLSQGCRLGSRWRERRRWGQRPGQAVASCWRRDRPTGGCLRILSALNSRMFVSHHNTHVLIHISF